MSGIIVPSVAEQEMRRPRPMLVTLTCCCGRAVIIREPNLWHYCSCDKWMHILRPEPWYRRFRLESQHTEGPRKCVAYIFSK